MSESILEQLELSDEAFRETLAKLVEGRDTKIWLARSDGDRLHMLMAVGVAQPHAPTKMFDHSRGFYLLGQQVPQDLKSDICALFAQYCATRQAVDYKRVRKSIFSKHWQESGFGSQRYRSAIGASQHS